MNAIKHVSRGLHAMFFLCPLKHVFKFVISPNSDRYHLKNLIIRDLELSLCNREMGIEDGGKRCRDDPTTS